MVTYRLLGIVQRLGRGEREVVKTVTVKIESRIGQMENHLYAYSEFLYCQTINGTDFQGHIEEEKF